MNVTQIKETCLYFLKLEEARNFYHHLLGLPVIGEVKDQHIFFRAGSSVLLCFNPKVQKQKPVRQHITEAVSIILLLKFRPQRMKHIRLNCNKKEL
jgi:catechol-2,3-dioxygenase